MRFIGNKKKKAPRKSMADRVSAARALAELRDVHGTTMQRKPRGKKAYHIEK